MSAADLTREEREVLDRMGPEERRMALRIRDGIIHAGETGDVGPLEIAVRAATSDGGDGGER